MATVKIKLTKGQFATIDKEDQEAVEKHSWCTQDFRSRRNGLMYAAARINKKYVYLHRFIMQAGLKALVDHRNGDGLDNRKRNLRVTSHSVNRLNPRGLCSNNTSGVRGVIWDKARNKFRAEIQFGGKSKYIGRFDTLAEAEAAWKAAEKEILDRISKGEK